MRALGFDVKKADVLKILRDYDREGTGKISFEDFNEVSRYLYVMKIVLFLIGLILTKKIEIYVTHESHDTLNT